MEFLPESMPSHLFGVLRGESVKWHWGEDELETQWSLSVVELALLPSRIDSGRLGCAILLKFFQFQGFFPSNQKSIPHEIVVYIAQATNSAPEDLDVYEWEGRTGQRHRKKILDALEFRSNNTAHRPLIDALGLLKAYRVSGQQYFSIDDVVPIEGIVKDKWRDIVVEEDKDNKIGSIASTMKSAYCKHCVNVA